MSSTATVPVHAREVCLHAALDGVAHNATQAKIIFDPSPEVDSIVEHLVELERSATPVQRRTVRALTQNLRDLMESNRHEAECHRIVAGRMDEPVRAEPEWTYRSLASALKRPLSIVADSCTEHRPRREAAQVVLNVTGTAPVHMLSAVRLREELGLGRFTTLQSLLAEEAWS